MLLFYSVSCSTQTTAKCQAALRTLKKFPQFLPTCLCREPHIEPECNQFTRMLFDHPCDKNVSSGIVKKVYL